MFDFGWTELLVIGVVALIVVGPKDLPVMFRAMGKFTGKLKAMGREFSRAMNDAADESGVNDISNSIKAAANPQKFGADKLREAANIRPGSETDKLAKKREAERAAAKEKAAAVSEERQAQIDKIKARTAQGPVRRDDPVPDPDAPPAPEVEATEPVTEAPETPERAPE